MPTGMLVYLILVNLAAFFAFSLDKSRAQRHLRRIPELRLMSLCLFGGSLGALTAMLLCSHKTQKPLFRIGVPFLLLIDLAAVYALCALH